MYKLNITNTKDKPFLQCIAKGLKKAEGRIATDYVRSFEVGSKLVLSAEVESIICEVSYMHFYNSFKEMLKNEGVKNMVPFAKDLDEAIKMYMSFPGAKRVKEMGCCAIGVKYLEGLKS